MKKMNYLSTALFAFFALIAFSFTVGSIESGSYSINTVESAVQWKGYKVTGEHAGVINLKSGNLDFDDSGKLTGGTVVIDMTSIKPVGMDGKSGTKLEGHLKSADFFGVEMHPTAKLEITKVAAKGTPGDYKVTANLSIKKTTKEIKFYANVSEENGTVKATADIKIDRTDFNVRYGSGNFFDGLGDKTIYDEFDLTVNLVGTK